MGECGGSISRQLVCERESAADFRGHTRIPYPKRDLLIPFSTFVFFIRDDQRLSAADAFRATVDRLGASRTLNQPRTYADPSRKRDLLIPFSTFVFFIRDDQRLSAADALRATSTGWQPVVLSTSHIHPRLMLVTKHRVF